MYAASSLMRGEVVLIRKNRPAYQEGKLNGVGGKVELNEPIIEAMIREFYEETGLEILDWEYDTTLSGDDFVVHFFSTVSDRIFEVATMTDEEVGVYKVNDVLMKQLKCMDNLPLLISIALDDSGVIRPVSLFEY